MRVVKADSSLSVRVSLSHASVHLNRGGITQSAGTAAVHGPLGVVGGGPEEAVLENNLYQLCQLVRSKTNKKMNNEFNGGHYIVLYYIAY